MGRVIIVVLLVVLTIYCLVDAIRTPAADVRLLPKPIWALVIVAFPPLGALAWLAFGRSTSWLAGFAEEQTARRPVAPDDDEEFLRGL